MKLIAAGAEFVLVIVLVHVLHLENRVLVTAFFMIPYLTAGLPVLRKAFLGIIHGQMFDESFLMMLASVGAFITGESEEAAAVMLFYQIGEWFQSYAVGRSRQSITELMDIAPEFANRELEDGSIETVDPDDVEVGDILVIKPGERIPVDGTVVEGASLVNTAALTGESLPQTVEAGSAVLSGCVNGEGLLRIRAEKAYEDSTVSKILELVENASEKKSKTETFITKFARWYTPIVVFGAIALAVIPSLLTGNPLTWIYRACTFLVISCPCALVISVPLSFFGGIGAASRCGVLVKGSNYLELLAHPGTVVTDKTGTLTEGRFRVSSVVPAEGISEEELLLSAAAAESFSTHPIAESIREKLAESGIETVPSNIQDTKNLPGQGIIAMADGDRILAGSRRLMENEKISFNETDDPAATMIYVAKNGVFLGAISVRDSLKPGVKQFVADLKKAGAGRIVMLTGDRNAVGKAVAAELGIDEVYTELLPGDKVEKVEQLMQKEDSGYTAFIGDGINDAPVLRRVDVGIAMGSLGSDAAIEAADVVIMDDDLSRIPPVIRIAARTIGISRQNIAFALSVKILILILGALGTANMWAAVFADVGVAVLCILNSMRLLMVKRTIDTVK